MSAKPGRNQPCPCGSGKKYKHCCELKSVSTVSNSGGAIALLLLVLAVGGGGAFATIMMMEDDAPDPGKSVPSAVTPLGAGGSVKIPAKLDLQLDGDTLKPVGGSTPLNLSPGGLSPTPGRANTPAPGGLTPQPPGPAPPGKVWSPEHGHWHDAQ